MSKIITFYNNKGGVSKTTTLFNVAVLLSMMGKKVLIADCDPQCNVTELFLASSDTYSDPDIELPGTSIFQALLPRFKGETSQIDPRVVSIVNSPLYQNLFLLRGDLEFSLAESYLARAIIDAITEEVHQKNTYVALSRLLRGLGELHGYDYILCDVGPSTGAITRMCFLSTDGFFIPLTPDRFCNQAVSVLGRVIGEWISKHEAISRTFEPFGMTCFLGSPILLGGVMQNFKVYGGARVKESYKKWQDRIKSNIELNLLKGHNVQISSKIDLSDPFVANIRDVATLAPIAQIFGRAIFDVKQEHTKEASTTGDQYRGIVWKEWEKRMREYQEQIEAIVGVLPW